MPTIMTENAQNLWIWFLGTMFATFAWTFALIFTGVPFGLYMVILIPGMSYFFFRKTTAIFDTTDEERERMRQDALKKIQKDFNNALKTLQRMGYVTDLTFMSYQENEWTEAERATIEKAMLLLLDNIDRRKSQRPLKPLHPEEIRYLVEQKRKQKEVDTFVMLKEEMKKRHEEIAMLEELMLAGKDEHPEADGVITDIEEDFIEIKKIEEELEQLEEDEENFESARTNIHDERIRRKEFEDDEEEEIEEEDEDLESLEEEVKALDEKIKEIESDEDYEDFVIEPVEDEPLIRQGKIYEVSVGEDDAETGFAPIKKPSIRDVLGRALEKLNKEAETDESKS